MKPLLEFTKAELEDLINGFGEQKYRASQIKKWLNLGVSFNDMTNLPNALRLKLTENCCEGYLEMLKCIKADDGTKKYLFGLDDGNAIESVFLPKDYGKTVCVSTQVGCAMGCVFCASGNNGLIRNLSASEILAQTVQVSALNDGVDRIVVMGMGEPLNNYEALLKFIKNVNATDGLNIGVRHITVSTCGITDKIRELANDKLGITLSVSLHAPTQQKREKIIPSAKKYDINDIINASRYYFGKTHRRVTFEYVLIKDFNDTNEDADGLCRLLIGFPCHINVIPVNEFSGYKQPTLTHTHEFAARIKSKGISATVRKSMGIDIKGACGQLRLLNKA